MSTTVRRVLITVLFDEGPAAAFELSTTGRLYPESQAGVANSAQAWRDAAEAVTRHGAILLPHFDTPTPVTGPVQGTRRCVYPWADLAPKEAATPPAAPAVGGYVIRWTNPVNNFCSYFTYKSQVWTPDPDGATVFATKADADAQNLALGSRLCDIIPFKETKAAAGHESPRWLIELDVKETGVTLRWNGQAWGLSAAKAKPYASFHDAVVARNGIPQHPEGAAVRLAGPGEAVS